MNRPIPFLMLLALLLVVPARAEEEPAPPKSEKPDRPEKPEKPAPDADDDKDAGDGDADKGRKAKANPNRAPLFELTGIDKNTYALEDFRGKWVVLEWTNPGCPFVQRHYRIGHMQAMQKKYRDKGVVWLTICSTNPNHRDYMTVEQWQAHAKKRGHVPTALLMDADGEVASTRRARRRRSASSTRRASASTTVPSTTRRARAARRTSRPRRTTWTGSSARC